MTIIFLVSNLSVIHTYPDIQFCASAFLFCVSVALRVAGMGGKPGVNPLDCPCVSDGDSICLACKVSKVTGVI